MIKPKIISSNAILFTNHNVKATKVIKIGDSLTANLKKRVIITCATMGLPDPKIVWKFNGKPIEDVTGLKTFRDGSLEVTSVSWEHKGLFECNAINIVGVDSATSTVNVVGKFLRYMMSNPLTCFNNWIGNSHISFQK